MRSLFTRVPLSVLLACLSLAAQTPDPQKLFQEGVAAQQRGDDSLAARKYREVLRVQPNVAVARVNLGATLAHLKRYDEAIEQYGIVLAADSANRPARLNLALAYQQKGDVKRAAVELEILHGTEPNDAQATMLLADCYARLDRYADAVRLLSPLEAARPDDLDLEYLLGSALIHAGRAQEGVDRVEKVAAEASNAEAYLLAGQARLQLNQYDVARTDADAAMRINPSLAGVQTLKGMVLEHAGDFEAAETVLRDAVRTDAKDFDAHFYLGSILYFKRDMEGAATHLQRALQLRPDSAQARYKLALLARTEGRLKDALQDLLKVTSQSPDWLEPHVELSALYYGLHRPDDAAREKAVVDRLIAAPKPLAGRAP